MSQRDNYEKKTEDLLAPIAEANGVKIYDVEYVKEGSDYYLRAYIDKEDFISDPYILEVSSPGLGRTLKKNRHLEYSLGEEVEVKLYKPLNGTKDFEGTLKSYDKETITLITSGEESSFSRKDIAVIRLKLDF